MDGRNREGGTQTAGAPGNASVSRGGLRAHLQRGFQPGFEDLPSFVV